MLGHELRNPLAAIAGGLTLLRMPDVTGEEIDMAQDIMDRQVHNITRLVNDLLEVGRVTMNKIILQKERTDLGRIVQSASAGLPRSRGPPPACTFRKPSADAGNSRP